MSNSVFATYCSGVNHTIGLTLNCAGPECGSFLKSPPFKSTCQQASPGGNVTCANTVTCSGGAFTDRFTITKDDNKVTIHDQITTQNGTTFILDTASPLNIANATGTGSQNACPLTRPQTFGLRGLLFLVAIASFLVPAIAEQSRPARLDTREAPAVIDSHEYAAAMEPLPPLALPGTLLAARDQGTVAAQLSIAASDVALGLADSGSRPDAHEVMTQLAQAFQGLVLPPATNIEVELAQGRVDDAIKDSLKIVVERALTAAVLAGAPETGGLDLLLLLEVHVAAALIVDTAFVALKKQVATTQPGTGSGSGTPPANLPDILGCNRANYAISKIFEESIEFGTDAWRDCKTCCVDWGVVEYARFGGVCGCCTLVSELFRVHQTHACRANEIPSKSNLRRWITAVKRITLTSAAGFLAVVLLARQDF